MTYLGRELSVGWISPGLPRRDGRRPGRYTLGMTTILLLDLLLAAVTPEPL